VLSSAAKNEHLEPDVVEYLIGEGALGFQEALITYLSNRPTNNDQLTIGVIQAFLDNGCDLKSLDD